MQCRIFYTTTVTLVDLYVCGTVGGRAWAGLEPLPIVVFKGQYTAACLSH